MNKLELKYGLNPNQKPASIYVDEGSDLPIKVLNGRPGYINFLDALNSWQLVREAKSTLGLPAAASFKHVSPAGVGLGIQVDDVTRKMCHIEKGVELTPLACAYVRARGADRMSSYGDWIALSDTCDESSANVIKHEVSDGIIAPGYTDRALSILKSKKKGAYNIVQIDDDYEPDAPDIRTVFGITFEQGKQDIAINKDTMLSNFVTDKKDLSADEIRDLLLSLITLKYTQSNSVCYCKCGQTIGVGAGQQSRIHCTRLAGNKADIWNLRHHERVLSLPFRTDVPKAVVDNTIDVFLGDTPEDVIGEGVWQNYFTDRPEKLTRAEKQVYLSGITGVSLGSDAFFPFNDNVIRAARSGVSAIVQPGGSIRDDVVIEECNKRNIAMAFCGIRLFHH